MATPNPDLEYIHLHDKPLMLVRSAELSGTDEPAPIIVGIGSSARRDLEGDEMSDKALHSLCDLASGYGGDDEAPTVNTAFIDHVIDTEHMLGTIVEAQYTSTVTRSGSPVDAVRFGVQAWMDNPWAARTARAVETKAVSIGYSVGFLIKDYEILSDASGKPSGIYFADVARRELSSTPMPANQLCWAEHLAKSLRKRGVLPLLGDVPELTYVARHWTDHDELDAVRLLKLAKRLKNRAHGLKAAELLGSRSYASLPDAERTELARQVHEALALIA